MLLVSDRLAPVQNAVVVLLLRKDATTIMTAITKLLLREQPEMSSADSLDAYMTFYQGIHL